MHEKVLAGIFWPPGSGLATSDLDEQIVKVVDKEWEKNKIDLYLIVECAIL